MKKSLLLFVALLCSFTHGQIISSTDSIIFPQIKVDSIAQSETYIKSLSTDTTIIFLKSRTNVFSYTDTLILFPNDSALLIINYKPEQNIVDNDFLILLSSDSLYSCIIKLSGSGKFGDSYDNSTFNLYDNQLRTVLSALVSGHTSLGYNLARDKMFETVDDYGGDTIECIYSGTKIKAADRTTAQNLGFNTEHTWPQSNFSEAEPMRSDLNHLFPTLADPNNRRSNYDFGLPVNVTWQSSGSKLGTNVYGQIVFEPRDVTKGDIARAVFYFVTRYQNWGTYLDTLQESVLKSWNHFDSVSSRESLRAVRIQSFQGKINPFVVHPQFVDRIYSFTNNTSRPQSLYLDVAPYKVFFDSTEVNDTSCAYINLINSGNGQISLNFNISDSRFKIIASPSTIAPFSTSQIQIIFVPDSSMEVKGALNITSSNSNYTVALTGYGKEVVISNIKDEQVVSNYSLDQNYPNPFNPSTTINFNLLHNGVVELKLFDILGNNISTLINGYMEKGSHAFILNADGLSSGIYFYVLRVNDFYSSRKMIYLK